MRLLFVLFALLSLSACKDNNHKIIKNDAGQVVADYWMSNDSLILGTYKTFYDDGTPKEVATYDRGKLNGKRVLYRSTGTKEIEEQYTDDVMVGDYFVYHENGNVQLHAQYSAGQIQGLIKSYYPDGTLKETVTMVNGEENGPFKEYHKNGKIQWSGQYLNGDNEFGLLEEYDDSGTLIKKMMCDSMAVCRTIWTVEKGDISSSNSQF